MSSVPQQPGGWWHDYVCPTHGIELGARDGDEFLCDHGCRLTGDKVEAAWLALEHQALARAARVAARRYALHGEAADRERAIELVLDYSALYVQISAGGWSDKSESWMLQGKLFAQALSEAQWAVGFADAIITLGPLPELRESTDLSRTLDGLAATLAESRRILVEDRDDQRSNYTAWLDAAARLVALASHTLGGPAVAPHFAAVVFDHMQLAVRSDGWEWEASTYYHVFVLRAYLLGLRGIELAELPADAVDTLRRMIDVLVSIAAPDGFLPALHDGPYDRDAMHREVLEICTLGVQLFSDTGLATVQSWVVERLGADHDGLEWMLDGWFVGAPLDRAPVVVGSRAFEDAGYVVLRDSRNRMVGILDAGPHGGAHGHFDKLALYLYGDGPKWQPAPAVPPYGHALRHSYYARTIAHPTVRVDGADQVEASAEITEWDAAASRVTAVTTTAIEGVRLSRTVQLADGLLVDVVHVVCDDGEPHEISLGLRPAVDFSVVVAGDSWRSTWGAASGAGLTGAHAKPTLSRGQAGLTGWHRASGNATLELAAGRGPSDDPSRLQHVGDWSMTASAATFVSVYSFDPEFSLDTVEADFSDTAVRITIPTAAPDSSLIEVGL
ncbi:heparinase II/III family protein [Salinibacterium sp. SWN1162]|uniref:heparinase II/III domain-containing protein n=1 Tax=Salinibacterium sp. SWN1162 TaxID=2792053 RepID=UPI0018CF8385|nr:heparinase II/III family protein [Salinibacterium sp. SWN1162]MBH0007963.1 heparinase II/III family protein [Salinibacterium sp. SWN1162]